MIHYFMINNIQKLIESGKMSPVIVSPIQIDITYGKDGEGTLKDSSTNMRKIRTVLHNLILTGIKNCVTDAITLARLIVPESDAAPGRYGPSYVSEKLMLTYIEYLAASLSALSRGANTLKDHYLLKQEGWSHVSYAEYMNEMTGNINWSKASSESKFIHKLDNFLRKNMSTYIQFQLDTGAPKDAVLLFSVS
jgi:hypothetical protein